MLAPGSVHAESLPEALTSLIKTHKRALAAEADLSAAKEQVAVSWGDWWPTLDVTADIGHEKQVKPSGSDDTDMVPRHFETTLTQKLWDFGSTNSSIRRSELSYGQALATRDGTRQTLLLEGITAYLNVVRSKRLVDFAIGSVANIKQQADLENARVQRGAGLSTDVLQAKTQLAGALARQIQAEGALKTSINRFRAVFGREPENVAKMKDPRLPLELLPKSLEDAIRIVKRANPQLKASRIGSSIAQEDVRKSRIDGFLPTFNAIAEQKLKEDDAGTFGSKQERLVKIKLSYDFNLGMTAVNSLRASEQTHLAAVNRFGDTRDLLEEQTRNAWDNLQTARANAGHLRNQADIAAEFLELARRERQLGNRSLIDVLAGETALINASSDATSAETDVAIAVFSQLNVMGALGPTIIE